MKPLTEKLPDSDVDVPVIAILERHLEISVHYQQLASKTGNPEGYAYVKIPDWEVRQIIDFLERQNAVHEAVRKLTDDQYVKFETRVYDLVADTDPMQEVPCAAGGSIKMPTKIIRALNATPAQLADALLFAHGIDQA